MKSWADMISKDRLVVRNLWWLLWLTKASLYVVILIENALAQNVGG